MHMSNHYRYCICDVFTDKKFGGNPLAVVLNAGGLNAEQMQKIAREFNFSESTFVFPAEQGNSFKVRIFTPTREVPFAGHPNVGTAFVLDHLGLLPTGQPIIFEEKAGLVELEKKPSMTEAVEFKLRAPETFSLGSVVPNDLVALALSLTVGDIEVSTHQPVVASSGLPFLLVEVNSLEALQKAKINLQGFEAIAKMGIEPDIHFYFRSGDQFDVRARMFAPFDGVNEDPATGSANCALAGLLASFHGDDNGSYEWKIAQGIEMGRPSSLTAFAQKSGKIITATGVAGSAILIADGQLFLN